MKIFVRVKPNMKEERIEKVGEVFTVSVKDPAREGKANEALIYILSRYFKVPKSHIIILSGFKSKNKVIEIITSKSKA
jgi:uncharacterized protein (TIGR00251 family)